MLYSNPDMKQKIIDQIQLACQKLYGLEVIVELDRTQQQHGDFSSNIAMQLAEPLKRNPREIAQEIVSEIESFQDFSMVGVAGPGFINISLTDGALVEFLQEQPLQPRKGMKVLVEYSDPNPFKPLHAGHLYTTLVGDVIARLIEETGATTIRINYGGDVGLHVAKSMWSIINELGGEHPEELVRVSQEERAQWLGNRYVEGNNAYEDDKNAHQEIIELNKKVYDLHNNNDHETPLAQIYWTCRDWSYKYFKQLYKKLEVSSFDEYISESSVTPLGIKTVEDQLKKGVYTRSEGAVIFDGEKFGLYKSVFISSQGLPTYQAKDVGLSLTKWEKYKFDESIIITANEQEQYMKVVIKSIEQFMPEPARRTKHLTHGIVKLKGGVKMSSRIGNIVTAVEILDAATEASKDNKISENEEVVLAAVKYALLKNRIGSDITYDPIESIALEGNSGPYLQYAYARACSILDKSTAKKGKLVGVKMDDYERTLVSKLTEYSEVVEKSSIELSPHYLCTYLYELAQIFNRFYENSRVIGDKREQTRIVIIDKYANILQRGLNLLGIKVLKSM